MPLTDKMLARKDGSVGYLTFNNPERHNAVSLDMWEAGEHYLKDFKDDPSVRVVVVTGAGGKAFVSGADISEFKEKRNSAEAAEEYARISEAGLEPSARRSLAEDADSAAFDRLRASVSGNVTMTTGV